jgi:hypothetical protein
LKPRRGRRSLHDILVRRRGEPFLGILCAEGPALWNRFEDTLAHCSVDFELLPGAVSAARPFVNQPRHARECSQEWIALRLTLEHLVYFLARTQLFLAGAVADAYAHSIDLPRAQRFGWNSAGRPSSASPAQMLRRWRKLLETSVALGDVAAEHRLIADFLVFVGSAHQHCSRLLLLQLSGRL